ncbi:MAG: molybdopterin-dependent oxidoreductase [Deltaproteobacteria bacterium]|nr:molybdopterin-dependent oxidoreductase [Deltaproteobacteria bacterium]
MAMKTGRPARLILSRDEDILSMSKRHPAVVTSKYGFDRTGRLVAADVKYILDSGAYSTLSPVVAWRGTVHAVGPYRCENVRVETLTVATNKVPCGAYRGFGSPQVLFAAESQMDEAAHLLGMDPLEIRRLNGLADGDLTPTGQRLKDDVGLGEAMDKAAESAEWPDRFKPAGSQTGDKRYGIGCSAVYYGVCLGAGGRALDRAGALVQLMYDGSALFAVGTTEMGQGMQTVLSQVVAEELGVPYENVRPVAPDTHMVPDSGPTVASRTTVMSGNALINAAAPIRRTLLEVAGALLDADPDSITLANGKASAADGREVGYREVLARCFEERRHLASSGWVESPLTTWDEKTGQGDAYITYAYAANVVEVEVDVRTGEVDVLAIHAAHDVGKAVNPTGVEGQIEGGSAQGLGYALMEEVLHQDGRMLNNQFSTYLIPTARDVPPIKALIVEHPARVGPYGAKGFAEQPLMGIAPAVANAVFNATGVRIRELPITPERLWNAMRREGVT